MALRERPDGVLSGHSPVLGLELRLDQGEFRFHDPAIVQALRTHQEAEARVEEETAARQRAEARVEEESHARREEAQARRQAETRLEADDARVAELEARLRALEGPPEAP